jgi:hypothetical protein
MAPKFLSVAAACAAVLVSSAADARADQFETFPLSEVRRGQKGYGLTTMAGTTPERFEFEVIGVNRNFLPKMDIILVKSDDPKLEVTGFWRGMSGSPLFIQGKLACAFSYGYRFNKVAIGGCTPIEYMKEEGFRAARRVEQEARPRSPDRAGARAEDRAPSPRSAATMAEWLDVAPQRTVASAMEKLGEPREPWLMSSPLPRAPARPSSDTGMQPAAVPLAMSGFSSPAFAQAKEIMQHYPVEPMQAGGTGSPDEGPFEFSPGGALAVQLIRGDMSAAATGTVSFVDNHRVLAFGHPLFQAGEIYAPVAAAEVHTVIPSAMNAFVVASPLRELGALVQDRQSTIMADTALETSMIPVDIEIRAHTGDDIERGSFQVEVLDNRFMTAALAGLSAMNAISHYLPDRDHATAKIESEIQLRGFEPIRFTDYVYAAEGAQSAIGAARGLRALVPLLMNPFAPVEIERVSLEVDVHYEANMGRIAELRMPVSELPPGQRTYVDVVLSRYDGRRVVERVPFDVPANLAGHIVQVEVSAGDSAKLDLAPPRNLADLIDNLRQMLPGNVFAVTLHTADEGMAVGGRLIRDLPASALDRLNAATASGHASSYRPVARSIAPTSRVISGKQATLMQVARR